MLGEHTDQMNTLLSTFDTREVKLHIDEDSEGTD